MDPLSAAASVTAVLTILVQTIGFSKRYIDAMRKSGNTASLMIEELETLSSTLRRLRDFLEGESSQVKQFSQTSLLISRMNACRSRLQVMNYKLEKVASSLIKQMTWPLSEKEHREALQEFRAFSQWIQFSLSIDASILLSNNSEDISRMLNAQLKNIQQLEHLESLTSSVESRLRIQETLIEDGRQEEEHKQLMGWLSNYDYEKKHIEVRAPRVSGTGTWLFDTEEFRQWYSDGTTGSLLWCHGLQGAGKSVLASLVIDRLKDDLLPTSAALAYLYFDQQDQPSLTPVAVIGCLSKQLLLPKDSASELIMSLSKTPNNKNMETMLSIFLDACQSYTKVYVILDALDECSDEFRKGILKFLSVIREKPTTRVLVTSRHHPVDIQHAFGQTLQLRIEAQETDLRHYLKHIIDHDAMAYVMDNNFKAEIIDRIAGNAQQLFLLPVLQVQAVLNAPTIGEMEEELVSLPSTLCTAFDETLSQIKSLPDGRKQLGMKSLMWIFYSSGNLLSVDDLRAALAIRPGQLSNNPRLQPSTEMILTCCKGLVIIDKSVSQPRFLHQALRDYLQTREVELFPDGRALVAKLTLQYLLTEPSAEHVGDKEDEILARTHHTPFLWYATFCWGQHVQNSQTEEVVRLALELLSCEGRRSCAIQIFQLLRGRRELYWSQEEVKSHTKLTAAVLFGVEVVLRQLVDTEEIDATTSIGTTALMEASSLGYIDIMKVLLKKGADPKKMNWYGSSLHCAVEAGQCEAIDVLLQTGINIHIRDPQHRTPLECAIDMRRTAAAKLLIERGARRFRIPSYDKPITAVADDSYEGSVYYEIGHRKVGNVRNALHYAIEVGNSGLIRTLLANGAAIDREGKGGIKPLHWAAANGKEGAVRLLLEAGAEVNGLCKGQTAYWYASASGYTDIQRLLVVFGAHECPEPTAAEKDSLKIDSTLVELEGYN